jgi:lambda family phage minor tail protein L
MPVTAQSQSLTNSNILYSFLTVDASLYGGPVIRMVGNSSIEVTFGGNIYYPRPFEGSGYKKDTRGTTPQPQVKFDNSDNVVSTYLEIYQEFINCPVSRFFVSGENLGDSLAYSIPETFLVNSYTMDTNTREVVFTLRSILEGSDSKIPKRLLSGLI